MWGIGVRTKTNIMKKVLFGFLPFFIMAICIGSLTACSSDDEDSPIVGTWKEVYENEGNVYTTTFVFNADGTGVRTLRQEQGGIGVTVDPIKLYYTYDPQSTNISLKFDGDDTLYSGTAVITGKTLMLRYNGSYYALIKN